MLNLCLGLTSKKVEVENLLIHNNIGILCLQEVEVKSGFHPTLLNIKNYNLELEINSVKARTGIYVRDNKDYTRLFHLEGVDAHLLILDVKDCAFNRIINVYRSFNPQGNINARNKFKYQLEIIKNAMCDKCILLGDFNLDYSKVFDVNYSHKLLFEDFEESLANLELIQLVNFVTWSRMVGPILRSSIQDHIYVKDPTIITNLGSVDPFFGDHLLVEFNVVQHKIKNVTQKCRDWRKYSKMTQNEKLSAVNWTIEIDNVQEFWNVFELLMKLCP